MAEVWLMKVLHNSYVIPHHYQCVHPLHWLESLNVFKVEKVATIQEGMYISLADICPAFHYFLVQLFDQTMTKNWLMKVHSFVWEPHCFSVKLFNIAVCLLHFRLLTQMVERSQSQLKSLRWGSPWVIRTLIGKSHLLLDVLTAEMLCRRWTGRGRRNRWAESCCVVWEQLSWWSLLSTDHRRSTATSTGESVRCETVDQLCKGVIIPPSFSLSSLPSPSLFSLLPSHSWNTLVHKNFEIEHACLDMERELYQLRQEAKERLVNVLVIVAALITHFFSL